MPRRRRGLVPFPVWIETFKKYNEIVSNVMMRPDVYKTVAKAPYGGAIVRIVLNHFALRKVHQYIAQGLSPDEAIQRALADVAETLTLDELRQYFASMGYNFTEDQIAAIYDAVKAVAQAASGAMAVAAATA